MVFKTNDKFVFHDSRGFESGQADELKIVQDFIKKRSQEVELDDQLHAIWYGTHSFSRSVISLLLKLGIAFRSIMQGP